MAKATAGAGDRRACGTDETSTQLERNQLAVDCDHNEAHPPIPDPQQYSDEEGVESEETPRRSPSIENAYAQLLSELDGADDLNIPPPTFWPDIPLADLRTEWISLREWVENLVRRYPHLDHHVIPSCWYLHNGHVEALAALRDHERISFAESSPASSPSQWQWTFAQIEMRLREWTAHAGCLSVHRPTTVQLRPIDNEEWESFLAQELAARRHI